MFNDPLVWRDAYARCKAIHNSGNLVAITSISINNIVTGLVKENAWTGLNDIREAGKNNISKDLFHTFDYFIGVLFIIRTFKTHYQEYARIYELNWLHAKKNSTSFNSQVLQFVLT